MASASRASLPAGWPARSLRVDGIWPDHIWRSAHVNTTVVKTYLPWVVAPALFMEQLDSTIVNTAVPRMAASLQVAPLSLKAVVASYILSLAVCIPVSGWMTDHFGTRRVFASAVAIFTLSSIPCGLAVNVPMLVVVLVVGACPGWGHDVRGSPVDVFQVVCPPQRHGQAAGQGSGPLRGDLQCSG